MERNHGMLLALFAGIEPIVIGLVTGRQWLVLLGLCNLFILLLRNNSQQQTKQSGVAWHIFSYKSHVEHLKNLSTQNNYFWAISFLAVIAGLIAYVLEKGDQYGKIALGLVAAWVAYWLIAAVTHGIKATWKSIISKVFGLLIVVWAWRAVLWSTSWQEFFSTLPAQIAKIFTIPKAIAPTTDNDIKILNTPDATGKAETPAPEKTEAVEVKTETVVPPVPSTEGRDATKALSFAEVVPALVKAYNLKAPSGSVTFANLPAASPLYNDFKAGYAARFFGAGINPSTTVSCNVYLVLVWLSNKRSVSYNANNVFAAYRAEAEKRGQTFNCEAGKSVTAANLP